MLGMVGKHSVKAVSEWAQMLDLADIAFKIALKYMFEELKKTIFKS